MSKSLYKIKYWRKGETAADAQESLHAYEYYDDAVMWSRGMAMTHPDMVFAIEEFEKPKINIDEFAEFNERFEELQDEIEDWVLFHLNGCTVKHPSLDRPLKVSGVLLDFYDVGEEGSITVKLYDVDDSNTPREEDQILLECIDDWGDLEIIEDKKNGRSRKSE
jgi:hypothetical protein